MAKSIEERIEDYYKRQLHELNIQTYTKNQSINSNIDQALTLSVSKSGGKGNNYPDIKLLLITDTNRQIPVMIEVKGKKGDLVSLNSKGNVALTYECDKFDKKTNSYIHKQGDYNYKAISKFAVNGAIHYANAILSYSDISEVIAIGINGYEDNSSDKGFVTEFEAYYLSKKLYGYPKKIDEIKDFTLFKQSNLNSLMNVLDDLTISPEEKEKLIFQKEVDLEVRVKSMHQRLYDDPEFSHSLETNQKLYLFCGLIMAGMKIPGCQDIDNQLLSNNSELDNDGITLLNRIKTFLHQKNSSVKKEKMIVDLLSNAFTINKLWKPVNGESKLKKLFNEVKQTIIPLFNTDLHLDFAGKIFNSLNDWIQIENDKKNDVVLTPRYITKMMVQLARTNKDSLVWDSAMGSAGFLVSAMEAMIEDAKKNIQDQQELDKKISNIKNKQLLGIEILGNVFTLAVLNMFLMGDGSTNLINMDSFEYKDFPFTPNVFLLNPPYSADGKGFNFVKKALSQMTNGYACILIQESAGSGSGLPYTKEILENNSLIASIHMPSDVFVGKSSVQVAIYLFKINQKHDPDSLVTFIDMSKDGYLRSARSKSSQEINLRDVDHAKERYQEVVDIVLGKKTKTSYYNETNGLLIKDTISLSGDDWTFAQHKNNDLIPTLDDYKRSVKDYLIWKVSQIIETEGSCLGKI